MRKIALILIAAFCLSGCASTGENQFADASPSAMEIPATETAASKCTSLQGSRDWHICVAIYDNIYTHTTSYF